MRLLQGLCFKSPEGQAVHFLPWPAIEIFEDDGHGNPTPVTTIVPGELGWINGETSGPNWVACISRDGLMDLFVLQRKWTSVIAITGNQRSDIHPSPASYTIGHSYPTAVGDPYPEKLLPHGVILSQFLGSVDLIGGRITYGGSMSYVMHTPTVRRVPAEAAVPMSVPKIYYLRSADVYYIMPRFAMDFNYVFSNITLATAELYAYPVDLPNPDPQPDDGPRGTANINGQSIPLWFRRHGNIDFGDGDDTPWFSINDLPGVGSAIFGGVTATGGYFPFPDENGDPQRDIDTGSFL